MKKIILLLIFASYATISKSQTGVTSYALPAGITNPRNTLKIDATGNKWVAFGKIGLGKFNGSTWTMYDTLTSNIPSNQVNDIAFDPANNVWVATTKGLSKFDGAIWTSYNVMNSGLPDDSVSSVYTDNADIWIGTRNGLAKLNGSTWTIYNTSNSGLTTNLIKCVSVESTGDVWIGTRIGLFKKSGSTWSNFISTNPYIVNTNNITCIYIDASNEKWIGMVGTLGNGVYKLVANNLINLNSLFSQYSFLNSGGIPYMISKGPLGGVMFTGAGGLIEITGSQIYKYASVGGNYDILDSTTGLVWYLNKLGGLSIYSFNFLGYTAPALQIPQSQLGYNTLDINMVKTRILDRGDNNWLYEVPKGSGRNAIFASALWLGGIDDSGTLHQGAMTYRQTGNDFWPGPLDTISGTTDSITSYNYDKVWKIDRIKIEEFKTMFASGAVASGAYTVENDIITWPVAGTGNYSRKLAPFIDVNGDGLYKPLIDGDYPDIKGDQMCFWIYNDNLSHGETGGTPLKVEIHGSSYAYVCTGITDSLKVLNYTTFYNYQIFNRGTENYHNTFLGIWQDTDLGSASDDFIGCTPSLNYGSFFNGDMVDDNPPAGQITYGIKPPMLSNVILNGPLAEPNDSIDNNNNGIVDEVGEKNLMTHFIYYNNDNSTTGNPTGAQDVYDYMNSFWRDSTHATYGGTGHLGSIPYNFMFDGIPGDISGWSEETAGSVPGDRRFLMSCGPFNLNFGNNISFDYAVVYTRDTASLYTIQNLYQKNKEDVMRIQHWFALDSFPSCALTTEIVTIPPNENELNIYPNPASENITINYTSTSKNVSIKIYDTTGKLVKRIDNIKSGENTINISELENGLYLLNLQDGDNSATKRFIKQ